MHLSLVKSAQLQPDLQLQVPPPTVFAAGKSILRNRFSFTKYLRGDKYLVLWLSIQIDRSRYVRALCSSTSLMNHSPQVIRAISISQSYNLPRNSFSTVHQTKGNTHFAENTNVWCVRPTARHLNCISALTPSHSVQSAPILILLQFTPVMLSFSWILNHRLGEFNPAPSVVMLQG